MKQPKTELRVLGVIPGLDDGATMCFSRREMAAVGSAGVQSRSFFLRSRTNPRVILKEMWRLRKTIHEFSPDVVHAQFGTVTAFVCVLVSPVPVVITYQGQDLNPSPADPWLRTKIAHLLSHIAATRAAQIICVSPGLREHIAHIKDRAHVVPSGVNLELFRPMPMDQCRRTLGWTIDEHVVLFNAGSDPVRKRIDLAKAAFAHAQQSIANLRLHILDGNTHPDKVPLYLCAADCLLVASDYEGSPNIVKESLACNLPIVSVDVGDVIERFEGVFPSAVVARDPVALGDALVDIISLHRRSNGQERVRDLSEQAVAKMLVSIYRLAAGMDANECVNTQQDESPAYSHNSKRMRVA